MKKILILIFLLSVTIGVSAQKMTIKTSNGQTVEISCDGIAPAEVMVINDTVVFKMPKLTSEQAADAESVTENTDSVAVSSFDENTVSEVVDTAQVDSLVLDSDLSIPAAVANAIAEELSPEYAEFNRQHANDHPTEEEVIKSVADEILGKDASDTVSALAQLFSGIRFTTDSNFVATYEQRKPKKQWRTYNTITLDGSFGKNISNVDASVAKSIDAEEYGDDTSVENKIGAGATYSHIYMKGEGTDSCWRPNPICFAISWGGMLSYSYEQDMGSYVNTMGKFGFQIGSDIVLGIDALMGCGITPYNTFYTNGIYHSVLNKSAFCFKYGLQAWGSLNFSKSTYTAVYARYITSAKPGSSISDLPNGWENVLENLNPSSWTVGLAVGYKFGAPEIPSTDKRLQFAFNTGYQLVGKQKGLIVSGEFGRLTQVSPSTDLNYGLAVEQMYDFSNRERFCSVLLSAGLKHRQAGSKLFWGAKLYGGVGDYIVTLTSYKRSNEYNNSIKKLCIKASLQLSTGYQIGKCKELFAACRFGGHLGKEMDVDGFENISYDNLNGFEMDASLGYRITF